MITNSKRFIGVLTSLLLCISTRNTLAGCNAPNGQVISVSSIEIKRGDASDNNGTIEAISADSLTGTATPDQSSFPSDCPDWQYNGNSVGTGASVSFSAASNLGNPNFFAMLSGSAKNSSSITCDGESCSIDVWPAGSTSIDIDLTWVEGASQRINAVLDNVLSGWKVNGPSGNVSFTAEAKDTDSWYIKRETAMTGSLSPAIGFQGTYNFISLFEALPKKMTDHFNVYVKVGFSGGINLSGSLVVPIDSENGVGAGTGNASISSSVQGTVSAGFDILSEDGISADVTGSCGVTASGGVKVKTSGVFLVNANIAAGETKVDCSITLLSGLIKFNRQYVVWEGATLYESESIAIISNS